MGKWKLKGCPRCNGDLLVSEAEYGRYENCLQCGYVHYSENIKLEIQNPTVFKEPITVEHQVLMEQLTMLTIGDEVQ